MHHQSVTDWCGWRGFWFGGITNQLCSKMKSALQVKCATGVLFPPVERWKYSSNKQCKTANVCRFAIAQFNESGYELLTHPPYSPDLALSDYFVNIPKEMAQRKEIRHQRWNYLSYKILGSKNWRNVGLWACCSEDWLPWEIKRFFIEVPVSRSKDHVLIDLPSHISWR